MKRFFLFLILALFVFSCRTAGKQPGDKMVHLLPPKPVVSDTILSRTVVIQADDKSEEKLGRFPWSRSLLGELLDKLEDSRLILIDFALDRKQGIVSDLKLLESMRKRKNVIVLARFHEEGSTTGRELAGHDLPSLSGFETEKRAYKALVPYLEVSDIAQGIGFSGWAKTSQEIAKFPLVVNFAGAVYPTVSLAVLKEYFRFSRSDFSLAGDRFYIQLRSMPRNYLNHFPNQFVGKAPQVFSFSDVLLDKHPAELFQKKIVIISYDFARLGKVQTDDKFSSVSPGILQAQRIESLISWYEDQVKGR